SLNRAGLRKLVIVTSHGGNLQAVELIAREVRARLGMLVVACAWHRFGYPQTLFTAEERHHGIHGGGGGDFPVVAGAPGPGRRGRTRCGWSGQRSRFRRVSTWSASSSGCTPTGRPDSAG